MHFVIVFANLHKPFISADLKIFMKKLFKLISIVLIPIIVGLILVIVGGKTDNDKVAYAGRIVLSVGIPVSMIISVVVGLVLIITGRGEGKKNDNPLDKSVSETEREYSEIEGVNSSYCYESRLREAEYLSRHAAENYKKSTNKQKVLSGLFLGFLIADFALILVFAFLRMMVGVIVCFSVFAGTIIICFIVVKLTQKTSMLVKKSKIQKADILIGEVKACLLSSTASTGGTETGSRTRIVNVIYRVIVNVQGKEYVAYSDRFFETGDFVYIVLRGNHYASIIDSQLVQQDK